MEGQRTGAEGQGSRLEHTFLKRFGHFSKNPCHWEKGRTSMGDLLKILCWFWKPEQPIVTIPYLFLHLFLKSDLFPSNYPQLDPRAKPYLRFLNLPGLWLLEKFEQVLNVIKGVLCLILIPFFSTSQFSRITKRRHIVDQWFSNEAILLFLLQTFGNIRRYFSLSWLQRRYSWHLICRDKGC